jgi:hypothetical protein
MSFLRWTPSFLGFPPGGWLAFQLAGAANSPLTAAVAGALAGTPIGAAQWLVLRPAVSWHWIAASALGVGAGSAVAATVTGSATTVGALASTGLIAGAAVGSGQGLALRRVRGSRTGLSAPAAVQAAVGRSTDGHSAGTTNAAGAQP